MLKRRYDPVAVVLALFVALVPILGAMCDKTAVTYASFCVALFILGYVLYKNGKIVLTKTAVLMASVALYSFLGLFWVSDKGAHFGYSLVFLTSATVTFGVQNVKKSMGEVFNEGILRLSYVLALIYGGIALFCQIFIESNLMFGGMDLVGGSSTMTACIMLFGIYSCVKLFENKPKSLAYYPACVFMSLIFVLAGSFAGYLCGGALLLFVAVNVRKKRAEIFAAWVIAVVTAVLNIGYVIVLIFANSVNTQGALRALVGVVGMGKGGYNASVAILNAGYKTAPPVFIEIIEALGIVGLGLVLLAVLLVWIVCTNSQKSGSVLTAVCFCAIIFTSSNAFLCMLPLFAMLFSLSEEGMEINASPALSFGVVLPFALLVVLTFSRIPYALGYNALELRDYTKAEEYFEFGAKCEMFNSQGWEMAYIASEKAFSEGNDNLLKQAEYAQNAQKFNKKNYNYRKYLSDVREREGDMMGMIGLWEGIISRYDKEALYPEYARKISLVMEKGEVNLVQMTTLYNTLEEYANKAVSAPIKKEVNDILAKSQKFYIEKREGKIEEPREEETIYYYEQETEYTEPTEAMTEEV